MSLIKCEIAQIDMSRYLSSAYKNIEDCFLHGTTIWDNSPSAAMNSYCDNFFGSFFEYEGLIAVRLDEDDEWSIFRVENKMEKTFTRIDE